MNLEGIVKKLFLGGTLAVAFAVSLVTIGSYAYEVKPSITVTCTTAEINAGTCKEGYPTDAELSNGWGASAQTLFSITVPKALTLSNVVVTGNNGSIIEAVAGNVATGTLSAKVTSNTGYTISLSATTPALTSSNGGTIAAGNAATANTWGIKKKSADNATTDAADYTGLSNSTVQFFKSTKAAESGATTNFAIGVLVDATLPAGDYSTVVTVTAVTN